MVQTRSNFVNNTNITISVTSNYRQERNLLQKSLEDNFPSLKNKVLIGNEFITFSDNQLYEVSISETASGAIDLVKINNTILNLYFTLKRKYTLIFYIFAK